MVLLFIALPRSVLVKPGAARPIIGMECFRVRDNSWMYLTSLVTTQIGIELATV